MITKIYNLKLSTNPILEFFLDRDNIIQSKIKQIMKFNSQII